MTKAIGIFSGGLDSLLSARLLMDQGLQPTLITFTTPFFPPDKARQGAAALGLTLVEIDIYDELLPLIKNPPHGRGKNMNPCIDCHALMLKKAVALLESAQQDGFIFSGEVAGQRPMSQNSRSLKIVARESGRPDLILRPLSAKLLPPTRAEEQGLVDRDKLLNFSGRGRRPQMALAEQYGLPIPPPAGGCLLTDPVYGRRLKWLMDQPQNAHPQWPPRRLAEIIKHGRLFAARPGQWLAVGRNQADNQALAALSGPGDTIFHLEGGPGPTVLLPQTEAEAAAETLELGLSLAAAYGDNGGAETVKVRVERDGVFRLEVVKVLKPAGLADFMAVKG